MHVGKASSSSAHNRFDEFGFAISPEGFSESMVTPSQVLGSVFCLKDPGSAFTDNRAPQVHGMSLQRTSQSTCTRDLAKIDREVGRVLMFLHLGQFS